MATAIPPHPTSQTINALLAKLGDADPDFRFMSLNDILTVLDIAKPDILHNDYNVAARTVDHLVRALDDQNGEVQNLAIKWCVPSVAGAGRCLAKLTVGLVLLSAVLARSSSSCRRRRSVP